MKRAVLEFQQRSVKRQQATVTEFSHIDIPQTLADLRSDLQCIEKVIMAVERLAVAQMEEGSGGARKSVSRKKKVYASRAARKSRVVVLRHSPEIVGWQGPN
jgi:hypothetical protein